jgi:2-methylcitrate dehydratase PrpD
VPSLNQRYASWAASLDYAAIPTEVTTQAKLRILDIVGAMLGGLDSTLVQQVARAVFLPENGRGTPVIGFRGDTGVASAAMLQGTLGCVLEFDDSHTVTGIHSSTPVVSAMIAKARQLASPGSDLVRAVVIGNELTCRLGVAAPGRFHRVGFHPTGVLAGLGSTYGVATLMRLQKAQHVSAAGIAGSFASGLLASFQDGTDAKSLHAGWSAAAAIHAAGMAKAGVSGPSTVYEGRFGLFRSHVQEPDYPFDFDGAESDLGSRWECLTIAPRAYPSGHYSQPFIDAALQIVRANEIDPARVSSIECLVADYMIPLLCEPREEKIRPATPWHARYSLPFCLAECIVSRRFDKHSLSSGSLDDPRYLNLVRGFRYRPDPDAADRTRWSGDVSIVMENGDRFHHRVPDMRGTPRNPMSTEDLVRKFLHNVDGIIDAATADRMIASILGIDALQNIESVFEPLAIRTPTFQQC